MSVCWCSGCTNLVEDTGPEITEASFCDAHKFLYEAGSPDYKLLDPDEPFIVSELDQRIDTALERLTSLRLDCVKYQTSESLLRHYERAVMPAVRNFVRLLQESGREDRLLDLSRVGYQVSLDDQGNVSRVRLRGWGTEPGEYGP